MNLDELLNPKQKECSDLFRLAFTYYAGQEVERREF